MEFRLLAILLLEAGKLVTIDRLIELLWAGNPPRSARGVAIATFGKRSPDPVVCAT